MAKEIPYFKFFTGEWANGDITAENYKTQGVFINICAIYWTKEGKVTETFIRKKIKDNKSIDILIDSDIIKVNNGYILICFLDEQLTETENIRKKNSEAGKESARKRALNKEATPVEPPLDSRSTESQPLREEKKREEKKREENIIERENKFRLQSKEFNQYDSKMIDEFCDYWTEPTTSKKKMLFETNKTFDISRRLARWSKNNFNKNNNGKSTNNQPKLSTEQVYQLNYEQNAKRDRDFIRSEQAKRKAARDERSNRGATN